jgi:hypothetical protein
MTIQQMKRPVLAAMMALGVGVLGLGSLVAAPAGAQAGQPVPPAVRQFTSAPPPTPQPVQMIDLGWYCTGNYTQFCNEYKNRQPHPDYP